MSTRVELVECPRDSWQGIAGFIPTARKIAHLRALAAAGFRRIDFGSFVSPRAVPQMADTAAVWDALPRDAGIDWIAIVANERGAEEAAALGVPTVGFPLSVNETFQIRNTGKDFEATWPMVGRIAHRLETTNTRLIAYLSMAFGNPYGEPHEPARVVEFARRLHDLGIRTLSLADTVGAASPEAIRPVFTAVGAALPGATLGLHLHQSPTGWPAVVRAALECGCRRFDSALGGIGGCPFAADRLVGNLPTEGLLPHLRSLGYDPGDMDERRMMACLKSAREVAA